MAEHTPGPWRVRYHKSVPDQVAAVMSDHELICAIYGEANARLIAAAPELLAALEQALAVIGSDEMRAACQLADLHGMTYSGPTVDMTTMRNLIAKARGDDDPTSEDERSTA